jgi:hypothetical protein
MSRVVELKKRIKKRSDRVQKTIYISESLFQEARRQFTPVSINKVIEELLREAINRGVA